MRRIFIDSNQLNSPSIPDTERKPIIIQEWSILGDEPAEGRLGSGALQLPPGCAIIYSPEPRRFGEHLVRLWIEVPN